MEFIDFKMSLSGIFSGERIVTLMQQEAKQTIMIENLPKPFACVATDLRTGKEVWLKKGSLFHAIRASAAIPLIFDPVKDEERSTKHRTEWLVDGAVVNPLPISLCRALGADVVIAVNLNRDILVRNFAKMKTGSLEKAFLSSLNPIPQSVHDTASSLVEYLSKAKYYFSSPKESVPIESVTSEPITEEESNVHPPNMVKVITTAINIMQQRIMTSRIAGDPPEIELNPKLTEMDTFDFHKGQYAIQCGEECVKQMLPMIQDTIKKFH